MWDRGEAREERKGGADRDRERLGGQERDTTYKERVSAIGRERTNERGMPQGGDGGKIRSFKI